MYGQLQKDIETLQETIAQMTEERKVWKNGKVTIGIDSGAELSVWPPELCPEIKTEPTAASKAGTKYYGPGDKEAPTLPDLGSRTYQLKNNRVTMSHKVHVVPVRKPLMATCDLNDAGYDVHLLASRRCYAEHVKTGQILQFERRGHRIELDAEVLFLSQGNGAGPARL
jgi:hypothetical protein